MGFRPAVAIALLVAACSFKPGSGVGPADDATRIDAPIDGAAIDADPTVDASVDAAIDAAIDAPPQLACDTACAAAGGGNCNPLGQCVINENSLDGKVTCPAGFPCVVICDNSDDCKGGVDCSLATECTIHCTGNNACQSGEVTCGGLGTMCNVTCRGPNACELGVDCGSSMCTVLCSSDGPQSNDQYSNVCKGGVDAIAAGTCAVTCCGTEGNLCGSNAISQECALTEINSCQ